MISIIDTPGTEGKDYAYKNVITLRSTIGLGENRILFKRNHMVAEALEYLTMTVSSIQG